MTTAAGVAFGPSITSDIESEIRREMDARAQQVATLGSAATHAWDLASRCVLGGKLVRPRLLVGAVDALTGSGQRNAEARDRSVRIAAAVELLHFAFLLHDDVIDGDLMRRGHPNFIGLLLEEWEDDRGAASDGSVAADDGAGLDATGAPRLHAAPPRLRAARSTAMLVGDLLLSTAHRIVFREAGPGQTGQRLLEALDQAVLESVSGELTDVALSAGRMRPELAEVVEMSRQKTATYSFELPLRSAAILTGLEPEAEALLGQVGSLLGLAYQLQDDLLSVFGHSDDHGKDPYSDLREGKETAIIALARRSTAWPLIEPHFGVGSLGAGEGAQMRSLLSDCGAEAEVRALVDELSANARELFATEADLLGTDMVLLLDDLIGALDGRRS
ncbi:polyprenyl synthetase family protein [Brevibacterium oceani]|uniref:polyprenyl synthetase family protein n=1 Tax=Brevibacterium oceani TaxID=358099 RepID=UPI0015E7BAEE|nr:polyprenyl synthetase family protein [Brevibacterium oceani]